MELMEQGEEGADWEREWREGGKAEGEKEQGEGEEEGEEELGLEREERVK